MRVTRFNFEKFDPLQLEPAVLAAQRLKLSKEEKAQIWANAIEDARRCVTNLHKHRANIVRLCLKSCDIHRGGGAHWSKRQDEIYTARRFAEAISVEYKTLMSWVRCWREIVNNLNPGEWQDEHYKYAQKTVKHLGADSTDKERVAAFRKLRDSHVPKKNLKTGKVKLVEQGNVYKLTSILDWIKSHRSFLKKTPTKDLDKDLLTQIRAVLLETLEIIDGKTA